MLKGLLAMLGPGLIAKLAGPSQLASLARTLLKLAAGVLLGMGFSDAAVSGWLEATVPIVSGLASLGIGMAMSALDKKSRK